MLSRSSPAPLRVLSPPSVWSGRPCLKLLFEVRKLFNFCLHQHSAALSWLGLRARFCSAMFGSDLWSYWHAIWLLLEETFWRRVWRAGMIHTIHFIWDCTVLPQTFHEFYRYIFIRWIPVWKVEKSREANKKKLYYCFCCAQSSSRWNVRKSSCYGMKTVVTVTTVSLKCFTAWLQRVELH